MIPESYKGSILYGRSLALCIPIEVCEPSLEPLVRGWKWVGTKPFTNMFARGPANLVPTSDERLKRPSHPKHTSIRAPTCSTDSHHYSLDSNTAFTYRSFRTSWKPLQSFWANSWNPGIRWPAVFRPHHPWLSYFSLAVNDVAYTHKPQPQIARAECKSITDRRSYLTCDCGPDVRACVDTLQLGSYRFMFACVLVGFF